MNALISRPSATLSSPSEGEEREGRGVVGFRGSKCAVSLPWRRSMNLVAAAVGKLILSRKEEVKASAPRLLRCRDSEREISFQSQLFAFVITGHFALGQSFATNTYTVSSE